MNEAFEWDGRNASPWRLLPFYLVLVAFLGATGVLACGTAITEGAQQGLMILVFGLSILLSPCSLVFWGFVGWGTYKALQTPVIAVLEPERLLIPESGTRGVYASFDEGYLYSPKKAHLAIRVRYECIRAVRRPTADELAVLVPRKPPVIRTVKMGATYRRLTVRGHSLIGEDGEAGAASLMEEELRSAWVVDPERALALELDDLAPASKVWVSFPVLRSPTLFLSARDPEGLIAAIEAKRSAS